MGLLKKRGTQRSDSTHVLAAVRSLNRLEVVGEALRLALNTLAVAAPEWLLTQVEPEWEKRYGPRFTEWHLPDGQEKREDLATQIGRDGQHLLLAISAPSAPAQLRALPELEILRQIWVQQYYIDDEQLRWRDPKDLPPARVAINSPYDTEARYSHRRSTIWVAPRLITNVELTPAPPADYEMTATIHQHLAEKDRAPSVHLVDAGYVDAEQLVESQREHQIDLHGPVVQNGTWQAKEGKGYDSAQFRVDWDALVATCPQGKSSRVGRSYPDGHGNPMMMFAFHAADCRACAERSDCTRSESPYRGRVVGMRLREEHEALQAARERQTTEAFKERYKMRAGIEGTLSRGVRRCGIRRSRYVGEAKTWLQEVLAATALNLLRAAEWLVDPPAKATRTATFVKLMAAHAA